jgi:hypothetical protein
VYCLLLLLIWSLFVSPSSRVCFVLSLLQVGVVGAAWISVSQASSALRAATARARISFFFLILRFGLAVRPRVFSLLAVFGPRSFTGSARSGQRLHSGFGCRRSFLHFVLPALVSYRCLGPRSPALSSVPAPACSSRLIFPAIGVVISVAAACLWHSAPDLIRTLAGARFILADVRLLLPDLFLVPCRVLVFVWPTRVLTCAPNFPV